MKSVFARQNPSAPSSIWEHRSCTNTLHASDLTQSLQQTSSNGGRIPCLPRTHQPESCTGYIGSQLTELMILCFETPWHLLKRLSLWWITSKLRAQSPTNRWKKLSCARKHEPSQFPGDLGAQIGLPPDLAPCTTKRYSNHASGAKVSHNFWQCFFHPSNLKSWKCASISLPTVAVDGRWSTDRHNSNQIKGQNIKRWKTPETHSSISTHLEP